ncbi:MULTISPECIES: hypothetical protein [Dysgonomonas]|uniref:Glycosyl transferase family 1 domain-containing protein n=1 Tax=Dysgonomonas gadei ATCC BAA-286 TaxID=742766 RepID=F5IUQ0_9BACT|nr:MULTISPECIES: hypothetical protein [Dysgonomonas]EGK02950.1 hypothetical protein HMPREF9455_01200 [Dysgonomonas gadei ATCC BAA-286]MBF0648775.1 hypothetical protein [Dysgonomonas sp. GY75]
MKKRIYLFPMRDIETLKEKNPYTYNLTVSLQQNFNIVNYGQKLSWYDIPINIFRTDFFYFNWIENSSFIKAVIFIFLFYLIKLFGKKIIWTHHNLQPHGSNEKVGKFLISFMAKKSDFVILHTTESYQALKLDISDDRVLLFPHPVFSMMQPEITTGKKYDILIWGNIRKSKGIEEFLEFLSEKRMLNRLKIKIIGKFESEEYFNFFCERYIGSNISISNKYIESEELDKLHLEARLVFFPYTGKSVFNSGALITSLPKGSLIVGPNVGAFKEMAAQGIILAYHDFGDVIKYLEENSTLPDYKTKIELYCKKNTWGNFSNFLKNKLY